MHWRIWGSCRWTLALWAGIAIPNLKQLGQELWGCTVNAAFNTNVSQRWLGRCPEKGLAAFFLLERLGVAGFPRYQLEVITNPSRRWAGMSPVPCGMLACPGRDLDPTQGQALLLRLFTSEIKRR